MKTKLLLVFVLAAVFSMSGARAQTAAASPTTPAPAVTVPTAPAPDQVVYAPRLPSATELTNAAAAQNLSVERIEQSATQVTAIYKNAAGQMTTVAYQLLPNASTTVATPTPAPVVVAPAPRVVYYEPAYRYYPAYTYDPWYWYPPVSFRFGLSYGFRGGYFRGGFHHGR